MERSVAAIRVGAEREEGTRLYASLQTKEDPGRFLHVTAFADEGPRRRTGAGDSLHGGALSLTVEPPRFTDYE
jgi:hypothetical protein